MKKYNVLPLVLVLPLLVGCGQKDIKAPKFAKEGDKVEYSAFNDAMNEINKEHAFFKSEEDYLLPSFKANIKEESLNKTELKRENKVHRSELNYSKKTTLGEYDKANGILHEKVETKGNAGGEAAQGYEKAEETRKTEIYRQKGSDEGKDYLINVNVPNRTYALGSEVTELSPYDKLIDNKAASIATRNNAVFAFAFMMMAYSLADEEEQAKFSFYKNDKIFTLEYKDEKKGEEVKDAEDKVKWTIDESMDVKFQIDLSKSDSYKATYYSVETESTNYNIVYDYCVPGDVEIETKKQLIVAEVAQKDISLKAQDLAKFTKI